MNCPHCTSSYTTRLKRTTNLGYPVFRCHSCDRTFNERTGTPFNFVEVPTDIVFQVLFSRVRFKLSLRDLVEFFLLRGFEFTHETVRDWEERFTPIFIHQLRDKRRGTVNRNWFTDEIFIKVRGKNCYLYRAIDSDGNLVDSMLSQKRDMEAAKAFFRKALELAEEPPERVVTDGLTSYPRAISEELGTDVKHERRGCQGNPVEPSHRPVKARYYPMLGFGAFKSAKRFCEVFDEMNQFLRCRRHMTE
ncbi:MAG: IS6 family transposase [Cyanobacteria bacterium J06597_1]